MLAFVIFAVLGAAVLVALVIYLYLDRATVTKRTTSIPGLDSGDKRTGNLEDIGDAGSFHAFISSLHNKYGKFVSYWHGDQFAVSTCSPDLFKQQNDLFDRPKILFEEYEPLISESSIQYANGPGGQDRRRLHDRAFSYEACKEYYKIFIEYTNVLVEEWKHVPVGQHISLHDSLMKIPLKTVSKTCFGKIFKDDDEAKSMIKSYDYVMDILPARMWDKMPPSASEEAHLQEEVSNIHNCIKKSIEDFRQEQTGSWDSGNEILFLDQLVNSGFPDDIIFSDALTFFIGGFHTVAFSITWAVYQLASNPDVQLRLRQELLDNLTHEVPTLDQVKSLRYLAMVVDETLRWGSVAPYAARISNSELVLDGHTIPKGTPIVQSLGTCLHSKDIWNEPEKFNPENFNEENHKKRHPLAFQPFGFAGKRKCPGYRFALIEIATILALIFRKFQVDLVPGQNIEPCFSLISKPGSEIWVTVKEIK